MMARKRLQHAPRRFGQRGMALITGMLLLLVVTVIAVTMFRSFGEEEQIAGNVREKQRAFNAAVSAQQYAEWWLVNGTLPGSATCNGLVNSDTGQVCTNTINFTQAPWTIGIKYIPFSQTETTTYGTSNQPSQGSYYMAPLYYITDLGPATDAKSGNSGELYQVDAEGFGGTSNAVAVVESTYLVSTNYGMKNLDISK